MSAMRFSLRNILFSIFAIGLTNCSTPTTTLSATEMEIKTDHGTLVVGNLRTPPGKIELPYVHFHQPGKVRPTVFFLGGGPGISNIKNNPPEQWFKDFDVVVLEYRGVGRSSIVLKSPHFLDGLLQYGEKPIAKSHATLQRAYQLGFADLSAQGVHFPEFSVEALADDIEQLRKELGLEQVYFVAHSFGTRVVLNYQTRYRNRAAGSILFAMNTSGGFIWQPEQTQKVWQRYRDTLQKTNPEQGAALDHMLREPTELSPKYGFLPVNNHKAMVVAFFLSFNGSTRDSVLSAMAGARAGGNGTWYMYSLSYGMVVRFGFNWPDFFVKGYNADCNPALIEQIEIQGKDALFGSPSSVLFAGADGFMAAGGQCASQAFKSDYRNTLAIMGEFDPSTPIERKPVDFPNERFIVLKQAGHADTFYGNQAGTTSWLRKFFLHPDQARPPGLEPRASDTTAAPKPKNEG